MASHISFNIKQGTLSQYFLTSKYVLLMMNTLVQVHCCAVPCQSSFLLRNHTWKVAGEYWKLLLGRSVMSRSLVGRVFPGKARIDRRP